MSEISVYDPKVSMTFEQAEEFDARAAKYFKVETNIPYKLTIASWRLYLKKTPVFNEDKSAPIQYEDKPCLELILDSVNGEPVNQIYNVNSKRGRAAFEPYCRAGTLTKKVFSFRTKGEGKEKAFQVAELGEREAINIK